MDLHLGHVNLELLNNFTTVVHHQPDQHFDQCKSVPIKGIGGGVRLKAKKITFVDFDVYCSPIVSLSKMWSYFVQTRLLYILLTFTERAYLKL